MFRVFSRNNIQATRKWSLIAGTNLIYNCKVPKVISHKSGEQQLTMTFQMVPGFLLFSWLVAHTTKTVFHILKYFITIERPINLTYFRRKNNCSKRSHYWCLLPKPPKAENLTWLLTTLVDTDRKCQDTLGPELFSHRRAHTWPLTHVQTLNQ